MKTSVKKNKKKKQKRTKVSPSTALAQRTATVLSPKEKPKKSVKRSTKGDISNFLSPCAMNYASTLRNPFKGPMGCVPTFPALLTRRVRVFARGTFYTSSTNSSGWIVADPLNFIASDQLCVATTNDAYAGSTIELHNPTTGVNFVGSNSEYTYATFSSLGDGANARVVGFAIRVQYIGTMLNSGGTYWALQEPGHNTLEHYSQGDLATYNETRYGNIVPQEWITLRYKPVNNVDLEMLPDNQWALINPTAGAYSNYQSQYMGIWLQTAVVSQPFQFEVFGVFEVSGGTIRGKEPSDIDYNGFSAVSSAVASPNFDHGDSNNDDASFWDDLWNGVKTAIPFVGDLVSLIF